MLAYISQLAPGQHSRSRSKRRPRQGSSHGDIVPQIIVPTRYDIRVGYFRYMSLRRSFRQFHLCLLPFFMLDEDGVDLLLTDVIFALGALFAFLGQDEEAPPTVFNVGYQKRWPQRVRTGVWADLLQSRQLKAVSGVISSSCIAIFSFTLNLIDD